ncbi:hypothetical protein ACQIBV_003895 [Yersinia enterocolitica]|nr:hypothetical protein [Yersinia enterocolitica]EKN4062512.1 hypothetical protein [Yersinia enterocolitica]HEN3329499.1 hypothetical protein [Yersinia enterocolitica]HEN3407696.1 hypothetical protein [Yersinia enterocolitica]HEN3414925.1 hypothetical protein [Yersinia enterocolitica]
MKELDGFTVEQLNDFIKSDHVQCGDVAALAAIALAAKRAEPVGYLCEWDNGNQVIYYGEAGNALDDDWSSQPSVHKNLPIYTTPQLNSPEIPEGWISIPRDMLADYRDVKNAEVENYKAGFAGYYNREGTRWARDFADLCEELAAIDKVLAAAPEKPL